MFRERDLVSTAPLQRWDPELPGAPAEAGETSWVLETGPTTLNVDHGGCETSTSLQSRQS